jgi:hypothetical protein
MLYSLDIEWCTMNWVQRSKSRNWLFELFDLNIFDLKDIRINVDWRRPSIARGKKWDSAEYILPVLRCTPFVLQIPTLRSFPLDPLANIHRWNLNNNIRFNRNRTINTKFLASWLYYYLNSKYWVASCMKTCLQRMCTYYCCVRVELYEERNSHLELKILFANLTCIDLAVDSIGMCRG